MVAPVGLRGQRREGILLAGDALGQSPVRAGKLQRAALVVG